MSIKQRSPGHWAIILYYEDGAGRRKQRWHSFKGTKTEAKAEHARLLTDRQQGRTIDRNKITVDAYLDIFLANWCPLHITAASTARYAYALLPVRKELGGMRLQLVRSADILALYGTLSQAKKNHKTIGLIHSVLRRALEEAKTLGLINVNPVDGVKPPKVEHKKIAILQPAEATELLERLRGRPLFMLATLALATGARRNELLALRWSHVDLEGGKVSIEHAFEGATTSKIKGPKSGHGVRTISLPASTVGELKAHRRAQQEQRLAIGAGRLPDDAYVLANASGAPLIPACVTDAWPHAMKAIGMPKVTLHSLRHTHASALLTAGVDITTVSRRLGHASPVITLKVYSHVLVGSDDKAAAIMDLALGGGAGVPAR